MESFLIYLKKFNQNLFSLSQYQYVSLFYVCNPWFPMDSIFLQNVLCRSGKSSRSHKYVDYWSWFFMTATIKGQWSKNTCNQVATSVDGIIRYFSVWFSSHSMSICLLSFTTMLQRSECKERLNVFLQKPVLL